MADLMNPEQEAASLLAVHGEAARCQALITQQFGVIQSRTQALIGLATLALTITGFSGPRMAASSALARWTMILGLAWVLTAVVIALRGALRIRWLTQITGATPQAALVAMIQYRDRKTRRFGQALFCLVVGLALYVTSVVAYMATGLQSPGGA